QSAGQLQAAISRLGGDTDARITLIAADGTVLADSRESPEHMENHKNRPEIQEAELSGLGASTRFSGTVHEPMIYVARRIDAGSPHAGQVEAAAVNAVAVDAAAVRYVRVALSLTAVTAEIGWSRRIVWTTIGVTLLLVLFVSALIARRLTAPLV